MQKVMWGEFEAVGQIKVCYYCGEPASGVDHVTPQSTLRMLGDYIENPCTSRYETVTCCFECNTGLGDRLYTTIAERKAAAKEHLRRKYRKYLEMRNFTDDDLEEFGPNMRSFIKKSMTIKKRVRMRLEW